MMCDENARAAWDVGTACVCRGKSVCRTCILVPLAPFAAHSMPAGSGFVVRLAAHRDVCKQASDFNRFIRSGSFSSPPALFPAAGA